MLLRLRLLLLSFGGGLLFLLIGGTFLLDPLGQGGDFGLEPDGNQGLSTIRGDMTAIFWVSGGGLIIGAWKQRGDLLLVAAAII